MAKGLIRVAAILALIISGVQFAEAGRIYFKAWFAQVLLEDAWQASMLGQTQVKPWPWADTWPVAKLYVPRLSAEQIVLHGDSGNSLAFGPAMKIAAGLGGEDSLVVISGHNDTHFEFLKNMEIGEQLYLENQQGMRSFEVVEMGIVDAPSVYMNNQKDEAAILLTTCYPFDSVRSNTSQRFFALAYQVD